MLSQIFAPYFRAGLWAGYCDSFKDSLNATFSRISISNLNGKGYQAHHDSSDHVIMQ